MISVLCPTRGRPDGFAELCQSMYETALAFDERMQSAADFEVIAYLDDDEPECDRYHAASDGFWFVRWIGGPRIVLSEMWNRCAEHASGEILMHCGDDIRFRTRGWNKTVEDVFNRYPDRIAFVHGDDLLQPEGRVGTHGFIHRRWMETVGYFVPPYFVSDYNDLWLTEVADRIGRHVYLPQLITEHMHPDAKKAPVDLTHQERHARHMQERPDLLYVELAHERDADAEKLRAVMQAEEVEA